MKRLFIVLIFLISINTVSAFPELGTVDISPSELWLGSEVNINVICTDNTSQITRVYADVNGPNIILPTLDFTHGESSTYSLDIDNVYLDRSGQFEATIKCENDNQEIDTKVATFEISTLTSQVTKHTDALYTDEVIETRVFVKKNDQKITSGIIFTVMLNGVETPLKQQPAYDTTDGWIIRLDAPEEGTYTMEILAQYNQANVSIVKNVEVKDAIDFEILYLDREWVREGQNITMRLRALDHGQVIPLTKSNIRFRVGSVDAEIDDIELAGKLYDVEISPPPLSAGTYELEARLEHSGNIYEDEWIGGEISYTVFVNGEILDENGKGMSLQISFAGQGIEKTISTSNDGKYSTYLPPGYYDIEIEHTKSTLRLENVDISDFDDGIRMFEFEDMNIPGIDKAIVFVYEVAVSYSQAFIELKYDERNVDDESEIGVYKCNQVNVAKKQCNSNWIKFDADIDTIRNLVRIETTSLSAFVVGNEKEMNVEVGPNQEAYNVNDVVKINGIVKDYEGNKPVVGAEVVIESDIFTGKTTTADNGRFSFEFNAKKEGTFIADVTLTGDMYKDYENSFNITIEKSKKIGVVVPEIIRLEQGQETEYDFTVVNMGQSSFDRVDLSVVGLPDNYYTLTTSSIENLLDGTERKVKMLFVVPKDAAVSTYSVKFVASSGNIVAEKIFGLTIVEKKKNTTTTNVNEDRNATSSQTNWTTGLTSIKLPSTDVILVITLCLIVIPGAYILKKRRAVKTNRERPDVRALLSEIKKEVDRNK